MIVQHEIKITGRVQGVGFRYYAHKKARETGIKGWVKNTPDGGVVVMAQGEEREMETFLDYLKIGPALSRVRNISISKMNVISDFDTFSVKY